MPIQSTKASVELTKNDEGTWLNVEIGGRKATLSLSNSPHGPLASSILMDWAESHFRRADCTGPTGATGPATSADPALPAAPAPPVSRLRRTFTVVGECLLAGTMTLVLVGIIGGVLYLCYVHAGSMAEGLGMAIGAGLLGGAVRYFKTTRRALHHLSAGSLFK